MAYTLRPARDPEEDLAAIRLFGQGLYNLDPAELAKAKTREDLANRFMLRMALREGETTVLDHDGAVVGASRITPSPWGIKDPETGAVEHWETVAIHPDHQGQGMSEPLRRAALDASRAEVIKSRIKNANPKSWHVAEKLGFAHHENDGVERVYIMRRPRAAALHEKTAGVRSAAMSPRIDTALTALTKTAGFGGETLDNVKDMFANMDPKLRAALIAAGVGGVGGAGLGMVTGFSDKDKSRRWKDPLYAGLTSAALSGGLTAAMNAGR